MSAGEVPFSNGILEKYSMTCSHLFIYLKHVLNIFSSFFFLFLVTFKYLLEFNELEELRVWFGHAVNKQRKRVEFILAHEDDLSASFGHRETRLKKQRRRVSLKFLISL